MKQIRFSHKDYEKFRLLQKRPPFTARLLQVFLLQDGDISEWFREYDTKYYTERGVQYYSLQGRLWIVLLLETEEGLFTTMRSANTSKLQYYQEAQGEEFEIVAREVHTLKVISTDLALKEGDTMYNHEKALPPGWEFTGCYPGGRDTHSGNLMRCLE